MKIGREGGRFDWNWCNTGGQWQRHSIRTWNDQRELMTMKGRRVTWIEVVIIQLDGEQRWGDVKEEESDR